MAHLKIRMKTHDIYDNNGHITKDCRYLKDLIERLIRKGHLIQWVAQEGKKFRDERAARIGKIVTGEGPVCIGSIRTIIGGPHIKENGRIVI